jgi:AraC-like DNA-binding protein
MTTMLYGAISAADTEEDVVYVAFFTLIYTSIYVALSIRLLNSSAFVIMTDHERRIVESMKISHGDNTQESAGTIMLYKNIYDRVLDYFTECKPYLNPKLTINDVVEVVFSNKLYISKAISQCTGRNFCQFVNYYRVIYAVELFRSDTNLKVLELATRSGFNSVVSFGMAFRLYMGEKPGDWCRREKFRLEKLKK